MYGTMASPPNLISAAMPSGPTDFFLPTADNNFLIMLVLMVNLILLIEFVDYYFRD